MIVKYIDDNLIGYRYDTRQPCEVCGGTSVCGSGHSLFKLDDKGTKACSRCAKGKAI